MVIVLLDNDNQVCYNLGMKTKVCSKCKQKLPLENFYVRGGRDATGPEGRGSYCKKCSNKRRRKYYAEHKKQEKARRKINESKHLEEWFAYKDTLECLVCGEARGYVLEFHHRDPSKKENTIASIRKRYKNWQSVLDEIEKCDVLCANCHRELHYFELHKLQ